MSYDYHLLRLRAPAARLNDLRHEIVRWDDWYQEGRRILSRTFAEVDWSEGDSGFRGTVNDPSSARLEIALLRGDLTSVFVHGSHHRDQRDFVRRVAAALEATAFDCQTGRAVTAPEPGRT